VIRLDGGLFFATVDTLEDRLRQVIHRTPGLTGIVLDCEGINFVDAQGAAKLREVVELVDESDVTLRLARLKSSVGQTLERDGVLERIGTEHIHGNVYRAVQAQLSAGSAGEGTG
jgi:SulP family sulfate permease